MKKKWLKKGSAVLLTAAMVLSLFPGMKGTLATVQAAENEAPTSGYWTDVAGLKGYNLSNSSTAIGKIRFGADNRLWAICGADGDNLALLSTSEFARAEYGSTSEYSNSNFVTKLTTNSGDYLSTSYFSSTERGKMADVTVSTNEPVVTNGGNHSVSVEGKKLYLANSQDQNTYGTTIYVGSGNNIPIDVTKLTDANGFQTNHFWLRSPDYDISDRALVAYPGNYVSYDFVNINYVSVVPAFNLNLSSDIFASAAEAASSTYSGYKENIGMTENTYTLRYTYTTGTDSAIISSDGTKVTVTNANGKYLMVQNSAGVYAMAIDSDSKTVNASGITGMALENFNNCKVWIESTDADRITTAKMAKKSIDSVVVTDITAPVAGAVLDTTATCATTGVTSTTPTVTWSPNATTAGYNTTYTASVTLTADDDYEFAEDATATVNGQSAASVTKNQDGTLTVTYSYKTAPKAVSNAYFATVEDLKECYNISDGTIGKIRFGLKEGATREWAICGADGENLALLSTSEFAKAAYGGNSKYSESNFVANIDTYLGEGYFSAGETGKMAEVTVSTNEPDTTIGGNHSVSVEGKKLYLANSQDQNSYMQTTIYVGSGNNIPIDVTKLTDANGFQTNLFWLRSPYNDDSIGALVACPGYYVNCDSVNRSVVSVVPAFNLNLSSDIFASAAEAASSTEYKSKDNMIANTFTLRYPSAGEESAIISSDGTKVTVTNANGKYLMVQNSAGVYAMAIDSDSKTVNASGITMGSALENFNNCKVWIESTDADRITTAKMATQATAINSVAVTDITAPVAGAALDTTAVCATTGVTNIPPTVTWSPNATTAGYNTTYTASVTLTADNDYEFASGVTATVNGQNATSVTKNQDGTLTVTYSYKTAPKAVSNAYFATVEDLKECYNISDGTIGKIRFGLKEGATREWAICGADGEKLALLSTSDFAKAAYGDTSEYSKSNFVANIDTYLGEAYFSAGETGKMAEVTVSTNEPDTTIGGNHSVSVEGKKLYLANSQDQNSYMQTTIYVGSGNNIPIDVTKLTDANGFQTNLFWLRSPIYDDSILALVAYPGNFVDYSSVNDRIVSVVPAFNLNLSSDIFASAAEAASSTYSGYKENIGMTENTYTLRYTYTTGTDSAIISSDGTKVTVTNANGKYLMVQNSTGVYAMSITSDNQTVNASDITMGSALENFNNCKVWIESTTDRITTAKLATKATAIAIDSVEVTDITAPVAGAALDTTAVCATTGVTNIPPTVTWTPNATTAGYNTTYTASVTLTADDDYEFATEVTATVNGQSAASVTKNQDGTVTVTYEFPATASPSTYAVTVNNGTGDGSYASGATVTITADTAPSGQEFDKWTVVSGGVTLASATSATTTFEMPANAAEVTANYKNKPSDPNPPAPTPTYTITAGVGGTHELSTDGTLTITCDGALDKLTEIYVDDKLVDAANYTLKSGSTILTFKAAYLNTLSVGTHKVKFQYSDGSTETTFVIKEASTQGTTIQDTTTPSEKDEVPKTGDSTPIAWLFILAVISGAGVVYFGRKKKTVR